MRRGADRNAIRSAKKDGGMDEFRCLRNPSLIRKLSEWRGEYSQPFRRKRITQMTVRWSVLLLGTCFVVPAGSALAAPADVVRDLASRVGPIVGQASTCQNIAQGRVQTVVDQFREAIRQASPNSSERDLLIRGFNSYIADGRSRMATSQV